MVLGASSKLAAIQAAREVCSDCCRQVVFIYVVVDFGLIECASGPVYGGHCRQVVLSRVTFSTV